MPIVHTNFASGTLSAILSDTDTSCTLNAGQGSNFPEPTGDEYAVLVLQDASGNTEIVHLTARTSDILTIVRARESTVAKTFAVGSRVEVRLTSGWVDTFLTTVPQGGVDQTIEVDDAGDVILTLKGATGQTANFLQGVDASDTEVFSINSDGDFAITGDVTIDGALSVTGIDIGVDVAAKADRYTSATDGFIPTHDADGHLTGEIDPDTVAMLTENEDVTGNWTHTGSVTVKQVFETTVSVATADIDPRFGTIHYATLTGDTHFQTNRFDNGHSATVMVNKGSYTLSFDSVNWIGGSAPSFSATGYNVVVLWKVDGVLYAAYIGNT
jgi:uncharacterized protein (DUF2141 family)